MKSPFIALGRAMALILLITVTPGGVGGQGTNNALESGFTNPPPSAQPRTWWHWTRGNISKEGITKDLEWMKRVGIGGFQLADVNFGSGQEIEPKVEFGSPAWLDMVRHAAEEAERLDLEMALFSSPGWSLAGGPWVRPEQAMKKLVWSDTTIQGPRSFSDGLPHPPTEIGLIRNMWRGSRPSDDPEWYRDHAVIAFPTPENELDLNQTAPRLMVNGTERDVGALWDDDLNSRLTLPIQKKGDTLVLEYTFSEPVPVRAFTLASRAGIPYGTLYASLDAEEYLPVAQLPGPQLYRPGRVRTFAFTKQRARFFRLEITGAPPSPAQVMAQPMPGPLTDSVELLEFKLHSGARVHRWEDKAGFSFLFDYSAVQNPEHSPVAGIDPKKILDLTNRVDENGTLHWEVPEGNWTILRSGYSLTGAKNRPAVPAGLGFEVDKLSKEHVLSYIENYLKPIRDELGPLFGQRLKYILLDSWEAGMQNWTDNMPQAFRARRGYDLLPYLPVLAGHIVGSPEQSDRFLWDFRRTLADMFAENFYAVITEYLHEQGLRTYSEASGVSLEILEDALLCKKYVDIPMGEFWVRDLHPSAMYHVDVRGAASAAHGYGKPLVAAEAFTGGNFESPRTLKRVSDYWFTQGINRLVFHTSTHQPLDTKPGNAMVGAHLHRNITWAELATPFMTYIARNSFMLQQGRFVADIAYLLKEGAPSTMPFWGAGLQPAPPDGYDYDYINTDILLNRISVDEDGNLVLPDGLRYRVLVLPNTSSLTLGALRKVHELVRGGATLIGPRPRKAPGLGDFPTGRSAYYRMVHELWGDLDGISRTINHPGKGTLYWGERLSDVLDNLGVEKDVTHSRGLNTNISWIHRSADEADIYFISSQADTRETLEFSFRVSGKQPELWYADDGRIERAPYITREDRTIVPISLDPQGSVFVVFRKETDQTEIQVSQATESVIGEINGPWTLSFPEGWGAPEEITLEKLSAWSVSSDPGIKYFSGTASYSNPIRVTEEQLNESGQLWLDLGEVHDVAEIYINDKPAGILWKEPYRMEITGLLEPGENPLRLDITNQWTNRLAGDEKLAEDERYLDNFIPRFGRSWEAIESGLLGPVRLIRVIQN